MALRPSPKFAGGNSKPVVLGVRRLEQELENRQSSQGSSLGPQNFRSHAHDPISCVCRRTHFGGIPSALGTDT